MNLGPAAAQSLAAALAALPLKEGSECWVAPPALSIGAVVARLKGSKIKIGTQNVHWEEKGAFTGELSTAMLVEAGCSFAIVGHSERRHLFGESDALIAQRYGVMQRGVLPIVCVGETRAEREAGATREVLERQLGAISARWNQGVTGKFLLAYEPVWAIGTGVVASIEDIKEAHTVLAEFWQRDTSSAAPPILYGGSVTPENFGPIMELNCVAGGLVGGASLVAEKFTELYAIMAR